jgi:hypothetical protein
MICPHCGKRIYQVSGKYLEQARQLFELLKNRDRITTDQATKLALENNLAHDTYEANRIWETLKNMGLLEGVGTPYYRQWKVKRDGTPA